jgi:hypothetical protein
MEMTRLRGLAIEAIAAFPAARLHTSRRSLRHLLKLIGMRILWSGYSQRYPFTTALLE